MRTRCVWSSLTTSMLNALLNVSFSVCPCVQVQHVDMEHIPEKLKLCCSRFPVTCVICKAFPY